MTLTDDEKLARKRQRMLEKAREYTTGTYCRKYVAPLFQKMIRAEWSAAPKTLIAIWCTEPLSIPRRVGECVCVTCGKRGPWSSGLGGFHCGSPAAETPSCWRSPTSHHSVPRATVTAAARRRSFDGGWRSFMARRKSPDWSN